jgi:hypothetical protein
VGAKTKTVGGGSATGIADSFGQFLQQGLTGQFGGQGQQQPQPQQQQPRNPFFGGNIPGALRGGFNQIGGPQGFPPGGGFDEVTPPNINPNTYNTQFGGPGGQNTGPGQFAQANPVGQTQGLAGGINRALAGDFGGPQNFGVDTSGLQGLVGQGGFDFGQFSPELANFGGFNTNALGGFNPNINLQGINTGVNAGAFNPADALGNQQFQNFLSQIQGNSQIFNNLSNLQAPGQFNAQLGAPDVSAYTPFLDRRRAQGLADINERFTTAGGSSLGSPAAIGSAQFLAERDAGDAATLADIGRQQQGLDLQAQLGSGQINAQNLGNYFQALSSGANVLGGQAAQGAQSVLGALGLGQQGALTGRGQDIDAQLGQIQAALGGRGQDLQSLISSGQLNLDAIKSATGLDLSALEAGSRQGLGQQELLNQFQSLIANNQLGNRSLDASILGNIGNLGLQGQQLQSQYGLGVGGLQNQALGQLLQQYGQAFGLGTPQRQTIQKPSFFQNALGAVTGLAGAAAPFLAPGIGSLAGPALSGLSQQFSPAQFNVPTSQNLPFGGFQRP